MNIKRVLACCPPAPGCCVWLLRGLSSCECVCVCACACTTLRKSKIMIYVKGKDARLGGKTTNARSRKHTRYAHILARLTPHLHDGIPKQACACSLCFVWGCIRRANAAATVGATRVCAFGMLLLACAHRKCCSLDLPATSARTRGSNTPTHNYTSAATQRGACARGSSTHTLTERQSCAREGYAYRTGRACAYRERRT